MLTAGLAIGEIFKAEGVKAVFGLPGGHVLQIYDALFNNPEIRHILMRHEAHGAAMAAAYAQLTGEPGICLVTAGPGSTNALTSVAEAYVGCWPMIVFAGRGPTPLAHKGVNQELDTHLAYAPVCKWSVRIDRPEQVVDIVRKAFQVARSGRPGPVVIDIPPDVLAQPVTFPEDYIPVGKPGRLRPDPALVEKAAAALKTAKKPLIVAGGGAVMADASPELVALAETLGAPVLTSLSGRGAIPDSHPLSAGGLGSHRNPVSKRLLQEADAVIGVGARFEQMESNFEPEQLPPKGATYIQLDIYPDEMGRAAVPDIPLVGDAKLALADIAAAIGAHERTGWGDDLEQRIAGELAEFEAEADAAVTGEDGQIHPLNAIRTARRIFPEDTIVGFDVGFMAQQMAGAFPLFRTNGPRSVVSPSSFYCMGFVGSGIPAAKVAQPDKPALCFVGDGSFGMVANVLISAREHDLAVTWVILNDEALGSIYDVQNGKYGGRIIGTTYDYSADFAAIAEASGCHGEKVTDPADLEAALARALAANEKGQPAVVDVAVARERSVASREYMPL